MGAEIFPGTLLVQSVLSEQKLSGKQKGFSAGVQSLIDSPVRLHQHLEEFDERGFDLSDDLEHYSSLAIS